MSLDKKFFGKVSLNLPCEGVTDLGLLYYILKSTVENEWAKTTTYGIQIDRVGADNQILDSASVPDISLSKSELEDFARKLLDHTVTPETLNDVVYDYLNSSECQAI